MERATIFKFLPLIGLLILTGCVSVPESVQLPDETNLVSFQQVAMEPESNKQNYARWGGVVANVENHAETTLLEVVHFPLRGYGRPLVAKESVGRFRVYVDGFLDPMVYQKGRMMTFAGQVIGTEEGIVGEHNYVYPTLHAKGYHLWEDIDRVEVESISFWPRLYYRNGWGGWFGWNTWPYSHRYRIRRNHDHYRDYSNDRQHSHSSEGQNHSNNNSNSVSAAERRRNDLRNNVIRNNNGEDPPH